MDKCVEFNANALYDYAKERQAIVLQEEKERLFNKLKTKIYETAERGKCSYSDTISVDETRVFYDSLEKEFKRLGFKVTVEPSGYSPSVDVITISWEKPIWMKKW